MKGKKEQERRDMDRFRWGLIAPGKIAHVFAQSMDVIGDAELYAGASRDLGRAGAFAQQYHAPKYYDSNEALLNDPDVDAVYIASPHRFHYEQARLCIEAGKPVLCEKPLTVNAAQAEELFRLAKEKQVFLMEALWSKFLPVYPKIFEWLEAGKIGQINAVQSSFGFAIPKERKERLYDPELAGGALLDMGVYNLTFSQWILGGKPTKLHAEAKIGDTGVDEVTSVEMVYPGDVLSQFTCTCTTMMENVLTICGTEGFIKIQPMFWGSEEVSLIRPGEKIDVFRPHRRNGFEFEVEEAMGCIREGKLESEGRTHAETLAVMELLDEVRKQIGLKFPFE